MKDKFHPFKFLINLGEVLNVSIKTALESSPKYFWIRVFLNIVSIVVPFITISISSQLISLLTDGKLTLGRLPPFMIMVILMFVINIVNHLATTAATYCEGMHQEILVQHIQKQIIKKMSNIDLAFFDSAEFYNRLNDACSNIYLISRTSFQAMDLIKRFTQLAVAFGYLASFHWFYAVLLTISGIPDVLCNIQMLEKVYSWDRENMSKRRRINYVSSMSSEKRYAKDVRIYGMPTFILNKFNQLFRGWFEDKRRVSFQSTVKMCFASTLPELVTALITFRLGYSVVIGILSVGSFVYFTGIISQLLGSMFGVVYTAGNLNDAREKIQNFLNLMKWENKLDMGGTRQVPDGPLNIEFRNVSFSYTENGRKILEDVSFRFHSREKLALVGMNGSGKTTLIKLLLRFYDPTQGEIRLNGINLKEYDLKSLRKVYSTLFQDYCNYAFTVRESVELADLTVEQADERLEQAIRNSGAEEFVSKFSNGLDTYLTREYETDGEELSGGQWQKVALARTFYREAPIYILDEPSAALDAQSEDELFRNFEKLYHDKGAILVSHRLSNVIHTDKILVLENGRLIEQGSHKELMNLNGRYAEMFRLQAEKYEDNT